MALKGLSALVYVNTKREADRVYGSLVRTAHKTGDIYSSEFFVHYSGLDEDRSELQRIENYLCSEYHCIPFLVVATLGLGLGIDCANVRLVVHYKPPSSLARWRQEF